MAQNSKNPSRYTHEDMELVDRIIITLAIKLHDFVETFNNHEKFSKDLSKILKSESNLALGTLVMNMENMNPNEPLFPEEINEQLSTKLFEESDVYLDSPNLSKVLKRLTEMGLLYNIKGKSNIKNHVPNLIRRKKFSSDPKPQGYHSIYGVGEEVEKYKKILSNPDALHDINKSLKNSGLLETACYYIAKNNFYAIMNGDENMLQFFAMTVNAISPDIRPTKADFEDFRNRLCSLGKDELERLIKEFAIQLMNNPSSHLFLVLSLPKRNS